MESPLLPLPKNCKENIRKLYDLDKPGRVEEAVEILREWIVKQEHLLKKDFSKSYLEITIISCKGSVEKAKKQIDRICTMKTLMPKFFACSDFKVALHPILELATLIPLPKLTKDYERVIMIKINNKEMTPDLFLLYYQLCITITEYSKRYDYVNGIIIVDDFRDVNLLDLMTKLNTFDLQKFMSILVEGYGAPVKGIHIISQSKAVDLLIKTVKPFLSKKINERIHCHPSLEDLYEIIPKEMLPVDYGGNERSMSELRAEWIEEVSKPEEQEYLAMMRHASTDESLRHSCQFNEEYMGMPGSFRNMTVD